MYLVCFSFVAANLTLWVAPRAGAGADGTHARPFGSIAEALARVRSVPHDRARIFVEPGTYWISDPLDIGPSELGSPLSIEAADPRQSPVIDGGRRIVGWQVQPNGWWKALLPEVASGKWYFSDLFVNGKRRFRPRMPEHGFYSVSESLEPSLAAKGFGYDRFGFSGSDIDAAWANRDDIELVMFHNWHVTVGRIAAIDGSHVTLKAPTGAIADWDTLPKGNRYFADNVQAALGAPGQWYLDRNTGVLTYIPMLGEKPSNSLVVAPLAERLVQIIGRPERAQWASNLKLSHLDFRHTRWNIPVLGRTFPQAEADLGGAVEMQGARNVEIDRCTVSQVGEYGVEIGAACKQVSIHDSAISDVGAGGVKIGLTNRIDDENLLTSDCTVRNCQIVGYGRRAPAAVGVWIGQSPRNTVSHCLIQDGYYTGVSVGWSWGYAPSASKGNVIEFNEIRDIGQNLLSDMGGIYTLGLAPGTVLRNNFIHDVSSFSYGGWGIYPDEGSSGLLIENNLVTRCKSAGFHQHYGQDNLVRNNIFAFNREAELMRTRAEDHVSFDFTHNIVVWDTGTLLASNWTGTGFKMDANLYWHGGKAFDFMGQSLAQWRARGYDVRSLVADPLFVDAPRDEFQLKANSPAIGIGFKPIEYFSFSLDNPKDDLPSAWPKG